ncbi:MAG: STAS domain-containing protein [Mycobacterium sp.]
MIASIFPNAATRGFTSHSGRCAVDCNGAQMRAYCRDQATVVKVTGEIDATNIDRFSDYTRRFVGEAPGLILDLSEVDFLCAKGISVLISLDDDCRAAGTHWAVVASPFVRRLLHLGDPSDMLPTAGSERKGLKIVAAQAQESQTAS